MGKRGLSTFNEKIEMAKNSLKVPIRDFYFIKTEHCFVDHATLAVGMLKKSHEVARHNLESTLP